MTDPLTPEERAVVADMRYGIRTLLPSGRALAIIDRLTAEVTRLRARNVALERVAKVADDEPCVECPVCCGDGNLGYDSLSAKYVACESCGGHEDRMGDGWKRSGELVAALDALGALPADPAPQPTLTALPAEIDEALDEIVDKAKAYAAVFITFEDVLAAEAHAREVILRALNEGRGR